jgi:hypothetical protein
MSGAAVAVQHSATIRQYLFTLDGRFGASPSGQGLMIRVAKHNPLHVLALALALSAAGPARAGQNDEPAVTLEQAMTRVQHDTGGKILSASTLPRSGHRFVHRIRVLTPNGHVREVLVPTEAARPADPTKKPAGSGPGNGNKE